MKSPGLFRCLKKAMDSLPVRNVWLALVFLHIAVLLTGLESAYVQVRST